MTEPEAGTVTRLLDAVGRGESGAEDRLWQAVYDEIRSIARAKAARLRAGQTLNTTALMNAAYIRLFGKAKIEWRGHHHFSCLAAKAMERIVIDYFREKMRKKRGGGWQRVPLHGAERRFEFDPFEAIAISDALARLEGIDKEMAEVTRLRYFAGMSVDETATAIAMSPRWVKDKWRFARAWLHRELKVNDTTLGAVPPNAGDRNG